MKARDYEVPHSLLMKVTAVFVVPFRGLNWCIGTASGGKT